MPQPVSQALAGAQRQTPQSIYPAGHPVIFEGTGFTGARCVLGMMHSAPVLSKNWGSELEKWAPIENDMVSDNLCCCVDMHRFLQTILFCDIFEARARCSALIPSEMPMQGAGSGSLSRLRRDSVKFNTNTTHSLHNSRLTVTHPLELGL